MFIKKVKYEMDKMKLENRIEYLENLICPNGKHEYEQIDTMVLCQDLVQVKMRNFSPF